MLGISDLDFVRASAVGQTMSSARHHIFVKIEADDVVRFESVQDESDASTLPAAKLQRCAASHPSAEAE